MFRDGVSSITAGITVDELEITGSGVNVTLTYDSSNYRAKYLISGSTTSNQSDNAMMLHELSFPGLSGGRLKTLGISAASSYIADTSPAIVTTGVAPTFFNVPFPSLKSSNYSGTTGGYSVRSIADASFSGATLQCLTGDGYTFGTASSNNALVVNTNHAGNSLKFVYDVTVRSTTAEPSALQFKIARFGTTADGTPNQWEADLRTQNFYTAGVSGDMSMVRIIGYDNIQTTEKQYLLCVKGMSEMPPELLGATRLVESTVPTSNVSGTVSNS